jgi:uncharacterized membrane protein YvlD (DUF360 family)
MGERSEANEVMGYVIDGFRIIFVTVICIYVLYVVIKELTGEMPAWIISIIFGLFILYINAVNSKIKKFFQKA